VSSTRRCCPDQMVLGFPPAQSKVDGGFPRRPSERNGTTRKRYRVRVEHADRDFSRPPPTKKTQTQRSATTKFHRPPTSATTVLQSPSLSLRDQWCVACKVMVHDTVRTRASSSATVSEEPTSTAKLRSSTGQSSQDRPDPH
jgi:hypothetical protein